MKSSVQNCILCLLGLSLFTIEICLMMKCEKYTKKATKKSGRGQIALCEVQYSQKGLNTEEKITCNN